MKTIEIKNVCFEVKKSVQKMDGYTDLNDCFQIFRGGFETYTAPL